MHIISLSSSAFASCGFGAAPKDGARLPAPSLLNNGGCDHLVEGVVPAVPGGDQVHHRRADVLLLEPSLHQLPYLGLLWERRGGKEQRWFELPGCN